MTDPANALEIFPARPAGSTDEERLLSALNEFGAEIESKFDDELVRVERRGPLDHSANNWASEIGHPCAKHLVHCRRDWEQRQQLDIDALWRIHEGNILEWRMKKMLGDIGFELQNNQQRFEDKELQLSGRTDGLIPIVRKLPAPFDSLRVIPAEIKSINPTFWETTETMLDIKEHRGWWIRKYPSQLNFYINKNAPAGFFILGTFGKRPRVIPMLFDKNLWLRDSAMARKVNEHVAAGTYPDPIPYDPSVCEMCGFNHICQPLRANTFREIPAGEVPLLQEFLRLKEEHAKFEEMKRILIGDSKKPGRYWGWDGIVENIEISTRRQMRTFYADIPKEIKEPFAEKREIVTTSIEEVCR